MAYPKIAVLFHRLGPYHFARLAAAGLCGEVVAIELSGIDKTYAWEKVEQESTFARVTVFADADVNELPLNIIRRCLYKVLQEQKPSVIAVSGWSMPWSIVAIQWALENGCHVIMMSESTEHDEPRKWWKEVFKKKILSYCHAGLVGGENHGYYLEQLGMPKDRIFFGYDVIDNAHFTNGATAAQKDSDKYREKLLLPQHFFLSSSRFVFKKNIHRLIRAYKIYHGQIGDKAWRLVLLGDGPLREEIIQLCKDLDIESEVILPGFIQYDELPIYYGLTEVFVHASTTEQWGLVINEAMAAGLPVIVSDRCGCAPDLVKEGHNGYLFDPYDSETLAQLMLKSSLDTKKIVDMGYESLKIIESWSPQTFADGLWGAARVAIAAEDIQYNVWIGKAVCWALSHR